MSHQRINILLIAFLILIVPCQQIQTAHGRHFRHTFPYPLQVIDNRRTDLSHLDHNFFLLITVIQKKPTACNNNQRKNDIGQL